MEKKNIKVDPKECVECLSCQLICSLIYGEEFNPEKARIRIEPRVNVDDEVKISFTDECVQGCSLCAQYCVFKALVKA